MLYLLKQDLSIIRLKEARRMSLKLNASKNTVNQMKRLQEKNFLIAKRLKPSLSHPHTQSGQPYSAHFLS
jgi:hypothetical protein